MNIVALGMAVTYLLLVVATAAGALLVLIWLFRDMPGEDRKTSRQTHTGLRDVDRSGLSSTPSAQAEVEHPENEAA